MSPLEFTDESNDELQRTLGFYSSRNEDNVNMIYINLPYIENKRQTDIYSLLVHQHIAGKICNPIMYASLDIHLEDISYTYKNSNKKIFMA